MIWVCSRIAPGLLQNRSGALPDRSLIAPGTHRPAPGTIRAAQGAKSGVKSGRKRKGKISTIPQKTITLSVVIEYINLISTLGLGTAIRHASVSSEPKRRKDVVDVCTQVPGTDMQYMKKLLT